MPAQQLLDNVFYVVNPYSYNTSHVGNHEGMRATIQFSGQNSGLPSSARTTQLMLDGPINRTAGLGIRAFHQRWGIFSNTIISGDTSYKLELSTVDDHYLRFGVGLASQWQRLDYDTINRNGYTNMSDPAFARETLNGTNILVGGGLLYCRNDLNVSFSLPYLFSFYNQGRDEILKNLLFSAGYKFSLKDDLLHIKPTVLLNPHAANIFLPEGLVLVDYQRLFWFQMGYRASNEVIAGAGLNLKRLKVGYSLSFPFGEYSRLAGMEHAVVLFFTGDKALLKRLRGRTPFIERGVKDRGAADTPEDGR